MMIGKLLLRSLHEMPKSVKQSRRHRGGGIQGSSWSMFVKYLHTPHNQTTCGLRQTAQRRLSSSLRRTATSFDAGKIPSKALSALLSAGEN